MGIHIVSGLAQRLGKGGRRVVPNLCAVYNTRAVVPTDGNVGIVGDGEGRIQTRPFRFRLFRNVLVFVVHPDKVAELVVGERVEAHSLHEEVVRHLAFVLVHTAVVIVRSVCHKLQLQVGETGLLHFLAEPFQRILCLFHTAKSPDEGGNLVNHEHGLSVNLVVFRLLEELLNVSSAQALKFVSVYTALPYHVSRIQIGDARIPGVHHIVVGPHQVELHFVSVPCFQETVGQGGLHEGTAVKPVPVKDEYVHTVLGCLFYLHFHDGGVGLVNRSPYRPPVPVVSGVALLHVHHCFPFTHSRRPEWTQARVVVGIGGIEISRHIILFALLCPHGCGKEVEKQTQDNQI